MSPIRPTLHSIVGATVRTIHRDGMLAIGGALATLVVALFFASWALSGLALWPAPSAVPLVLELVFAVAAGAFAYFALRRVRSDSAETRVAAAGEEALGLPEGSVRGVLELSRSVPEGTSPALYRHAEAALDRQIEGVTVNDFSGSFGAGVRRRRTQAWSLAGGLAVLLVIVAAASPSRTRAGFGPLLHPVAHLSPPPLPAIVVEPGDADVPRGASLSVRVRAPEREAVLLEWRSAGALKKEATISLTDGAGAATVPNVDAVVRYWIVAPDGAVSDTFTIRPTDPLLVSELTIDVVYPAYLGRAPEQFQSELPSLEIPEGTELRINGHATRAVGSALIRADSPLVEFALNVNAEAFSGRWVPRLSGSYSWQLSSPSGTRAELVPPSFELTIIPDLPPEIQVTFPGVDTTLTPDLLQGIVADARDDHGLVTGALVSWRTSSAGQKDAAVEQSLTLEGANDRAMMRALLDVRERGLLPGDTLSYFLRVTDNSPRRQTTVSETYRLRLPSMDELRKDSEARAGSLEKTLEDLAKTARDLEKATRDLNRRNAGDLQQKSDRTGSGSSQGNPGEKPMDFDKSEQVRSLVDRQQQMVGQVDQAQQRIEALERAMEAAGLRDPELQKRLEEMRNLYDKMLTPELRKQLEELKQNVDKMDPQQVQKALEELAKQQEQFREQLERSLELMRRAAAEQEMNSLAQQTKELATQQQAVTDQMKREGTPEKQTTEQQKELSAKADSLSNALQELMKKLSQQGEGEASKQTGEAQKNAEQASGDMKKAAQQAQGQGQQPQQAAATGQQAADKLQEAAKTLDDARKQMAEGWKKEVEDALDKAANDALSLAQKQNEINEKLNPQMPKPQMPQPPQLPQPGQQGQQQQGQQGKQPQGQQGQQQGQQGQQGQQQQGQQQGGQQGQKPGQQGQQGQQGQAQQQGGQQQGGQQGQQQGGQQPGGQSGTQQGEQSLKQQQSAVKQGLEQIGQNVNEAGQRAAMTREVGSALGRANLSVDEMMKALEQGRTPSQEGNQALNDLNRLALQLAQMSQQIKDAEAGTGLEQAMQKLAEIAKQQGGVNGQSSSLAPMALAPQVMADQLTKLAQQQREIAQKLGGMNNIGGREDVLGRIDELAKEANELARALDGGRLSPQTLARQERLFHRLLDAGRTLERDEYSEERKAERPGALPPHIIQALKPGLLDASGKIRMPTEQELQAYPPAYRRYILAYFESLNRAPVPEKKEKK